MSKEWTERIVLDFEEVDEAEDFGFTIGRLSTSSLVRNSMVLAGLARQEEVNVLLGEA